MKISVIPETFCPSCRVTLNRVHETHGEDSEPNAGDVVICENCGDLSVLSHDLQLRRLNNEEHLEFELRPEIINWQVFFRWRGYIQEPKDIQSTANMRKADTYAVIGNSHAVT